MATNSYTTLSYTYPVGASFAQIMNGYRLIYKVMPGGKTGKLIRSEKIDD